MYEQVVQGGAVLTQGYGCTGWACATHSEWTCPNRGCSCRAGFHAGVDLAQAPGRTPVLLAVGYGTRIARLRSPASCGGLGPFAVCIASDGAEIWYGHCSKDLVGIGARVVPGQPIALMGSLGCSNGNHVHFEVQPAGSVDGCHSVDPTPYLTHWPGRPPVVSPPQGCPAGTHLVNGVCRPDAPVLPPTPGKSAAPWVLAAGAALLLHAASR